MNEEIRKTIFALADEKYKEFHGGLCPNTNNIVGVRVPVLRNYAKDLAKQDWKTYLENAQDEYYEEVMLQGMVIGLAKMPIQEKLQQIKKFVPKIDNWAVCDVSCAGFKVKEKEQLWEFIKTYQNSKKEFELRFMIVMMLDHFVEEKYVQSIFATIDTIKNDEYYVQMAVAWLLSVLYVKFPKETLVYLKRTNIDNFTFNKAIQKMIESYRVNKEDKEMLRKLKR